MHLIQKTREPKQQDFIKTASHWVIPFFRKSRNRRYNAKGEFIGYSKPRPVIDLQEVARVKAAHEAAAKLPPPVEGGAFDLARYRPLPGRVLVSRGPWIKEEKGVLLPEDKWRHQPWWVAIAVGDGVTACEVGDRIVFGKGFRPKECWLGPDKFYLGREQAVVGIVESPL